MALGLGLTLLLFLSVLLCRRLRFNPLIYSRNKESIMSRSGYLYRAGEGSNTVT